MKSSVELAMEKVSIPPNSNIYMVALQGPYGTKETYSIQSSKPPTNEEAIKALHLPIDSSVVVYLLKIDAYLS